MATVCPRPDPAQHLHRDCPPSVHSAAAAICRPASAWAHQSAPNGFGRLQSRRGMRAASRWSRSPAGLTCPHRHRPRRQCRHIDTARHSRRWQPGRNRATVVRSPPLRRTHEPPAPRRSPPHRPRGHRPPDCTRACCFQQNALRTFLPRGADAARRGPATVTNNGTGPGRSRYTINAKSTTGLGVAAGISQVVSGPAVTPRRAQDDPPSINSAIASVNWISPPTPPDRSRLSASKIAGRT